MATTIMVLYVLGVALILVARRLSRPMCSRPSATESC